MTEKLIDYLIDDLRPVRRAFSPWLRSSLFLGLAAMLGLMIAVLHGKVVTFQDMLDGLLPNLTLVGSLLTGLMATIATFMLAEPGRDRGWLLLPVPGFVLWLSTLGHQCLTNWVSFNSSSMTLGQTSECMATLFLIAIPLGLFAIIMLRATTFIAPTSIALMASLAISGISAAAMNTFHPVDTSVLILGFNAGLVVIIACISLIVGRRRTSSRCCQ